MKKLDTKCTYFMILLNNSQSELIYGDRSQNGGYLWEEWIYWLEKLSKVAFWGAVNIFILMGVTWVHAYVKIHWAYYDLSTLVYVCYTSIKFFHKRLFIEAWCVIVRTKGNLSISGSMDK